MTDYTKSTNFATKDNLSSGNALKIVKGTEIDTEFNNIQTAIATKADLASPTFTGTPTLPTGTIGVTQSASNNSTALATTAFVQSVAQVLFPVGAIYTATVSTNPATLLGFGTWTAFGAGRTIIGNGGGFTAGNTGGSADAITVSHTHTATSTVTDPTHSHGFGGATAIAVSGSALSLGGTPINQAITSTTAASTGITVATSIASSGSSGTNANLPPYIVVYMWTRTA
jgi:hypothetical protein